MKPTIGILETGTYNPAFVHIHGSTGDWFKRFLGRVSNDGLDYRTYRAIDEDLPGTIAECDGYIITGSPASVTERAPWMLAMANFCMDAMKTKPVVGICFGHQLLCQALGGKVKAADVGWGIGVHRYAITNPADWMVPPTGEIAMLASHIDQVTALPPGAVVLAQSDFCPHAMLQLAPNCITIQAHPEATRFCFRSIYKMRRERFAPVQADRALASLKQPTDEDRVGHWIMNFYKDRINRADT